MKKIAIDARESGTSSGRYVDKLVEYLHRLKPDYEIVVITKPGRLEYMRSVAPNFEIVTTIVKEFTLAEQTVLNRQITNIRADLVHFTFPQQPVLYRQPTVTTIHDLTTVRFRNPSKNWLVFTFKQWVYKWVIKTVVRKAKTVIAISDFTKDDVAKFARVNSRKITTIYEAADYIEGTAEPVPNVNADDSFIMYVGRPQPHKNLKRLVDAFVMLKTTHPSLKLVLAGKRDKTFAALERSVTLGGITDVVFTDFVSDNQLKWLYQNCAAYCFPSLSEGFGLPGIEAMVHGAPVVSSNATSLPEIYGEAAEYCDPLDPFSIASAVARVIDDPKRAATLKKAGNARAATFSWQKMAQETVAVYDSVLTES